MGIRALIILSFALIQAVSLSYGQSYGQNLTVAESLALAQEKNQEENQETQENILASSSQDVSSPNNTGNDYYQEVPAPDTEAQDTEYLMLWVKLILIMAVFCGGAYVLLRYLKKKGLKQNLVNQHLFQSLAEFPLGLNKKIQIVKILNDFYVLALGQDDITLLSKIEDKESIDMLNLENSLNQNQGFFEESLKNYLNVGGWSPISMTQGLKKKIKGL